MNEQSCGPFKDFNGVNSLFLTALAPRVIDVKRGLWRPTSTGLPDSLIRCVC